MKDITKKAELGFSGSSGLIFLGRCCDNVCLVKFEDTRPLKDPLNSVKPFLF